MSSTQRLYAYYRATERMWEVSHRDEAEVPALQEPMEAFRSYLGTIREDLLRGLASGGNRRELAVTISHALRFHSWQSLALEGLSDSQAAELATQWIAATGGIIHPGDD